MPPGKQVRVGQPYFARYAFVDTPLVCAAILYKLKLNQSVTTIPTGQQSLYFPLVLEPHLIATSSLLLVDCFHYLNSCLVSLFSWIQRRDRHVQER